MLKRLETNKSILKKKDSKTSQNQSQADSSDNKSVQFSGKKRVWRYHPQNTIERSRQIRRKTGSKLVNTDGSLKDFQLNMDDTPSQKNQSINS